MLLMNMPEIQPIPAKAIAALQTYKPGAGVFYLHPEGRFGVEIYGRFIWIRYEPGQGFVGAGESLKCEGAQRIEL